MAGKFSSEVNAFVIKTSNATTDTFKEVVSEVFTNIVELTPVDWDNTPHKGLTKANWQIGLNSPSTKDIRIPDITGSITISRELGKLDGMTFNSIPDTIYISNNEKHINKLEYGLYPKTSTTGKTAGGYSVQAPKGMVRTTIAKFKNIVSKATRRTYK